MAQENTNNQEIDIRRIVIICLQHWYWFLIGLVLCGAAGLFYYLRTTPKYQTQGAIMLRQKNDTQLFSNAASGALDMLGISMNGAVEDEVQVLMSRDLMYQAIDALNLWQSPYYKEGMRWKGEFPSATFHVDTISLTEKAQKKGFVVKVKQDRKSVV